jgi:Domain of unknown function (DUF4296)
MRKLFSPLLFIFIISCVQDKKIPEGIILQNNMRKIMWDMMRADAYVSEFILKDSTKSKLKESSILYEQIFKLHNVTLNDFRKSISFYETRPDLLKTITDSLRNDERRSIDYQNKQQPRPQADSTFKKMRLSKKQAEKNN